ncbi:hypothetical protein [Nitrosospira sp. Nsp13]|uniref:hypothetical protein n=1 Tax=Nitrosospira sp. Nsp13 TaxID=1855332 RepID=UPI00088BACDA|nr:hypothetical protein [Nitrosospira sp. Nsp13]SCY17639.1 hypothetical protein SAMN05216308_10563 [Nitrosospira sp. Nsp13]
MDNSEQLVEQYLIGLNRGAVIFEPNGNIPPDFSLESTIGVEVRRLNQNYEYSDGSAKGLETLAIPLWQRLHRLLPSIGPSIDGESWFVGTDFRRPIGRWAPLWTRIRRELVSFMVAPNRKQCTLPVTVNFQLDLIRASKDHGSFFLLGASSDGDSGGWVMGEVGKNLQLCIAEKEKKIAPYRAKYSEWWLILPDHIDFGVDPEDHERYRTWLMPNLRHSFAKIVLLDPRNHHRWFEL